MNRLLIIEDQKKLLRSLRVGLEEEGYSVVAVETGEAGLGCALDGGFDAVVLDLMLPGCDGFEVLAELRRQGYGNPVLILTARDDISDRVRGLDCGADDYLVKPFAFAELLARLRALIRRGAVERQYLLRADDLEMNLVTRRVSRAGVELDLSKREYELLEYLLRNRNTALSRETIAREVWQLKDAVLTNVIDVYVNMLRKKVEPPGVRQLICTVRGVGYCLKDPT